MEIYLDNTNENAETKHAYLIITHQFTFVMEMLLRMLDDKRNDIYIHIDKKVKGSYAGKISALVKESGLYFVKRHKVYWGHVSLVKAEYELFQAARKNAPYAYYHLISGNDLPIKSQDDIHAFFERHYDEEFIAFCKNEMTERVLYKWLFVKHLRVIYEGGGLNWFCRKIIQIQVFLTQQYIYLQKKIGYMNPAFPKYKKSSEWVSLTEKGVDILLAYRKKAIRGFRKANCPDEHYKATIFYCVMNGLIPWPNGVRQEELKLYKYPMEYICMKHLQDTVVDVCNLDAARYIDWTQNLNLTMKDWDRLVDSDAMFCRKVVDDKLANKIFERFD